MELTVAIDFIGLVLLGFKHANLIEKPNRVKSNGVGLTKKLQNKIYLFCRELLHTSVIVHKYNRSKLRICAGRVLICETQFQLTGLF
jgi:hypothetical protein